MIIKIAISIFAYTYLLTHSAYSFGPIEKRPTYKSVKRFETQLEGIRIAQIVGKAYGFFGPKKPIRALKKNRLIKVGTILATASNSLVYLEFDTNGVVVLAPKSQLMIRKLSSGGLRHISLLKGSLYFRTKRWKYRKRPPGVMINIRSYPHGYYGENYVLTFTQDKKEISVKSGHVTMLKLTPFDPNAQKVDDEILNDLTYGLNEDELNDSEDQQLSDDLPENEEFNEIELEEGFEEGLKEEFDPEDPVKEDFSEDDEEVEDSELENLF